MKNKLNILILHGLRGKREQRSAVRDLEYLLPDHRPDNRYFIHPIDLKLPDPLKSVDFDVIILGTTFLSRRYDPRRFSEILSRYDFIRDKDAVKLAFPQDDYDSTNLIESIALDWNLDVIYSVLPAYKELLYPRFLSSGKDIETAYTGYINDKLINRFKHIRPYSDRAIDVSYRANAAQRYFGKIGYEKAEIGRHFREYFSHCALTLDISVRPDDTIVGSAWLDFIEDSRTCLLSQSGSSLLDRTGELRQRVEKYVKKSKNRVFKDVQQKFYQDQCDGVDYTAISPRSLEAALAKTVQIAIPGNYSGIMEESVDYIPYHWDNPTKEIIRIIKDDRLLESIANNCREKLLSIDSLRAKNQANKIIDRIKLEISRKNVYADNSLSWDTLLNKYNQFRQVQEKRYFFRRGCYNFTKKIIKKILSMS